MTDEPEVSFTLALRDGYAFTVDFGDAGIPPMTIDEAPPLGKSEGPDPSRMLAASIAGCLGASLLFCLRKAHIDVATLRAVVRVTNGRNEKGRLRVKKVTVRLAPTVPAGQHSRMSRCLEIFEDFCVVTASVREGMEIDVKVDTLAA
jgi:organic hydroperoxide reductase OsmC/OhrA